MCSITLFLSAMVTGAVLSACGPIDTSPNAAENPSNATTENTAANASATVDVAVGGSTAAHPGNGSSPVDSSAGGAANASANVEVKSEEEARVRQAMSCLEARGESAKAAGVKIALDGYLAMAEVNLAAAVEAFLKPAIANIENDSSGC